MLKVALCSKNINQGFYYQDPQDPQVVQSERRELLISHIRAKTLTLKNVLHQRHMDLIIKYKHDFETKSFDFFRREILPGFRANDDLKEANDRRDQEDAALRKAEKEAKSKKEAFDRDAASRQFHYVAPQKVFVSDQEMFDDKKSRDKCKKSTHGKTEIQFLDEFIANHDAAGDSWMFYDSKSDSAQLKTFCSVQSSLTICQQRKQFNNDKVAADAMRKSSSATKEFPCGNQRFKIVGNARVHHVTQSGPVELLCEENSLAAWSFRHLDSVLKNAAEQPFQDVSVNSCIILEEKYQKMRDVVFSVRFPQLGIDEGIVDAVAGGGERLADTPLSLAARKKLPDVELFTDGSSGGILDAVEVGDEWAVDFLSMSARKKSCHQLMYSDVELKRQEILWAYECERAGNRVWCCASFNEARQLETIYREDVPFGEFTFDSTLWYECAAAKDTHFNYTVARGTENDFVTISSPGGTKCKQIFRFVWDAVQGDVLYQCSQWLYSLETHFNSNIDSYCFTEPNPTQMIESIWRSMLHIHFSLSVHKGCKGECDPEGHFIFFQKDLFVHLSPAVLCVAGIGMRQLHSILNGKIGVDDRDHFKCKTWCCPDCHKSDEPDAPANALVSSDPDPQENEAPLSLENESDQPVEDISTIDISLSSTCTCRVLCQFAYAISSWHCDSKKHLRPRNLAWPACRVNRLPFPDGFEQMAKLFCTTYKRYDMKFMKDLDTPNLLGIFLFCRYFQIEKFGWKIPNHRIKEVKDGRNELLCHTKSGEECLKISCRDYKKVIEAVFEIVVDLARPVFARNVSCLRTFLPLQQEHANGRIREHLAHLKFCQDNILGENLMSYSGINPSDFEQIREQHLKKPFWFSFLDQVSLSLQPQDQVKCFEESMSSRRNVRQFLAKECKKLKENAAAMKDPRQRFDVNQIEKKLEQLAEAIDPVILETANLLLIAKVKCLFEELLPALPAVDAHPEEDCRE